MRLSLFLSYIVFVQHGWASKVNLYDALDNNMIEYQIQYLPKTDQTGNSEKRNNIQLTLKNLTNKEVTIEIPSGTYLDELSNQKQDHVIIDQMVVTLLPKFSKKTILNGYCVQYSKGSPDEFSQFKIIPAKKEFVKLSEWLLAEKMYNHTAQSAFWCISDSLSINTIYNEDKKRTLALWTLLSDITHRPVPKIEDYKELFVVHERFEGKLNFYLDYTSTVSIQIKDKEGNIITSMVEKKPFQKGMYIIKYHVAKTMSESEELNVVLEIDRKIVSSKKHLMRIT